MLDQQRPNALFEKLGLLAVNNLARRRLTRCRLGSRSLGGMSGIRGAPQRDDRNVSAGQNEHRSLEQATKHETRNTKHEERSTGVAYVRKYQG
jgi:hypothetical protein